MRQSAKLMPCLLLIAAVFLSLVLGFATATECAAWGVTARCTSPGGAALVESARSSRAS